MKLSATNPKSKIVDIRYLFLIPENEYERSWIQRKLNFEEWQWQDGKLFIDVNYIERIIQQLGMMKLKISVKAKKVLKLINDHSNEQY